MTNLPKFNDFKLGTLEGKNQETLLNIFLNITNLGCDLINEHDTLFFFFQF